ncbi:probable ATP-dependent DNA helicase HFM1 isoform X2 [Zootermopsis nevadensis]|uniref:probable ATP-dependent DNA helicase HFM1 isoform X2 n=1 Tax=Zootermopsis nevadensis TaxID=136037 RepID=UPI000B8E2DE3|nr:probable ATP-dependent DNA helicase HFM1 isoform X2 [Zootermopsis nevadensis]
MDNIFISTSEDTYFPYLEQNAPTVRNLEEDGSIISEPISPSSSPVAADVQTISVHNPEDSSGWRHNDLCSIYEIPRQYQHIFASYPCFNAIQSKVLDDVLYSDTSIVVSAPTGSGKTVIFELAVIRLLIKLKDVEFTGEYKIVYMAPVKALCSERFQDWRSKFSSLGVKCKEYTGDTDENDLSSLSTYHLILTTPEKWDSLTRKWKDNKGIVQMVKLFLIDEVGSYDVEHVFPP